MPRYPRQIGNKAGDGAEAGIPPSAENSLLILVPLVRLLARAAARDAVASLSPMTPATTGDGAILRARKRT